MLGLGGPARAPHEDHSRAHLRAVQRIYDPAVRDAVKRAREAGHEVRLLPFPPPPLALWCHAPSQWEAAMCACFCRENSCSLFMRSWIHATIPALLWGRRWTFV